MAESETEPQTEGRAPAPKKGGKLKWIIMAALIPAMAGAGFYLGQSGLIPLGGAKETAGAEVEEPADHTLAFLPLDPIVISIGGTGSLRNLRFRAQLQVDPDGLDTAEALRPRIVDIATAYLRALPVERLEEPTALLRIRAQLLRRFQMLAGPETVEAVLVSEFVIS